MRTKFTTDDRGVSEVIGAILVFGLLIALMAILQTQAVPAANEEVEFNHNQEVQDNLIGFQEAASRTAAQGSTESVGIKMGTTYPSRMLFFNPQNPSGQLRTVGNSSASISNVQATDPTIAKYIDGSVDNLDTKRIEYKPNYHEFEARPTTVLEYGVLYNDFGERRLIQDEGQVVSGNSVNLMFFTGNISRTTGGSISLNAQPASAPARTVTVRPQDTSKHINITIPSRLSASEWRRILSNEDNVDDVVNGTDGTVIIQLDSSVSRYTLRMPKIGVGNNVRQPDPVYIVGAEGTSGTVPKDSVRDISFEIRDKYNNPVRGEEVNITLESGANGSLNSNAVSTDSEGRATVRYSAPNPSVTPVSEDIRVSFDKDPTSAGFDASNNPEDFIYSVVIVDRSLPSGPAPSISIDTLSSNCATDDDGGLLGTTILGGEAAEVSVDWTASISPPGEIDEVIIEMVDSSNNQLASSSRYSPNSGGTISESIVLRDERMDKRSNGESCGKSYDVRITTESDGGKRDSDDSSISVPSS